MQLNKDGRNRMNLLKRGGLIFSMIVALSTQAEITYVNAIHGSEGNTFASGKSHRDTSWIIAKDTSNPDNKRWDVRKFGTGGQVYQANVNAIGSTPELTTQFTITSSNGWYDIYVFFYDHTVGWNISAGLTSGALTTYTGTSPAVDATTLSYVSNPTFFPDSGINLYAVKIGQVELTEGSKTIPVFIDKLQGLLYENRTWYDGVGYEASEKDTEVSVEAIRDDVSPPLVENPEEAVNEEQTVEVSPTEVEQTTIEIYQPEEKEKGLISVIGSLVFYLFLSVSGLYLIAWLWTKISK